MGNTQTQNQLKRDVELSHSKFKMVNQMILSIPFEQKLDILEWQKLLKDVKDCDPQFLLMPKKYMITEQSLCGSSGLIKIVYDSFTYSFDDQIKNHHQKFKHFQQSQVWYLLFVIISSVKQMERLSMKVGDIRPYNIFVNQNGQVKLSGVYSWPRQVQNYLKTSFDKTVTYLAPEQLVQCRSGYKRKHSYIIGESFSVGLTLLHTCLLKPMDELYNLKKYQFSVHKLEHQIHELRKLTFWNEQKQVNMKYSNELIAIIVSLLDLNQATRLSTLQLFNELQPHAEEILNLVEFQVPNLKQGTPAKQVQKVKTGLSNQQTISAQYSSIKKKQFNEAQSIGFQTAYGCGIHGRQVSTTNNNLESNGTVQITPQRGNEMQANLYSQNPTIYPKGTNAPRQSLNEQKYLPNQYQPNPAVKFNVPAVSGQFRNYQVPVALNKGQNSNPAFETTPYYPPGKTLISYQQKYEVPQVSEYSNADQPGSVYFNQGSTYNYQRISDPISAPIGYVTSMNYPFSRSMDLETSGFTYMQKNRNSSQNVYSNNPVTNLPTNYGTSTVRPVVIPSESNTFNLKSTPYEGKTVSVQQLDFLKKIDQQLNKSKQMYLTGSQ